MYKQIATVVLIILIVALGAWWFASNRESVSDEELTSAGFLSLLGVECVPEGIENLYQSCTAEITEAEDIWTAQVTYSGLFDDSIQAARIEAKVSRENGEWVLGEVVEAVQCQPGRGHQDFSAELCV